MKTLRRGVDNFEADESELVAFEFAEAHQRRMKWALAIELACWVGLIAGLLATAGVVL